MGRKSLAYQFRVTLRGIAPPIWRRIQVPTRYTFWGLHVAIQDSMGWLDYHLHMFRVPDPNTGQVVEIGIPDDDPFEDDIPCLPGWEIPTAAYFLEPGARAQYEYDFGDSWEHEILLEEIVERVPKERYPKCLAGARACPPEDCGGVWGYEELLATIGDPSHEEYESTMKWLGGGFAADAFDPRRVRFDSPTKRWRIAFASDE